mmetsp:Transcript_35129/g.76911  ORF Transcript_35129/g.76911 Transcript_35129/m.76911 type:complete len:168 (+) Transcript_35129:112-615(+)
MLTQNLCSHRRRPASCYRDSRHLRMSTKPRPNQPCPCGSGQKFKKCCFLKGGELISARPANYKGRGQSSCRTSAKYRFRVGDHVLAYHGGGYQAGRIVALDYFEPGWMVPVPYQIQLADDKYAGRLIYAPTDDDSLVKALPETFGRIGSNICVVGDRQKVRKRRLKS